MANIKKNFNFRNGVQVDDDNLLVTSTGLVGIGTTVPTEALDVRGNVKIIGDANITNATVGILTLTEVVPTQIIGAGVSIKSGIVTAQGTGIVTFYGDARFLQGMPTSQWEDTNAGFAVSSIYNTGGTVGIATTNPQFALQVGENPNASGRGVGISSAGNIKASGIITATTFSGTLSGNVSGNVTGNLSGNISGDTVVSGTATFNDIDVDGHTNLDNVSVAGITSFAGNTNHDGGATVDLHLDVIGLTTMDDVFVSSGSTFRGTINANGDLDVDGHTNLDNVSIAGVTTFGGIIEGTAGQNKIPFLYSSMTDLPSAGSYHGAVAHVHATGSLYYAHAGQWWELVNKESDGRVGTGTEVYNVASINSSGIITAATELNSPLIGVGTDVPANDIQVRKVGNTEIQITSDTGSAGLTVGRESGTGNTNNAEFRYGGGLANYSTSQSLDIVNYGTHNFNYYLSASNPGGAVGDFHWHKGLNNTRMMTLTNTGLLGIGETQPTTTLHVQGISTVTSSSFVGGTLGVAGNASIGGNLNVSGSFSLSSALNANVTGNVTGNLSGSVNDTGISTFARVAIGTYYPADGVELDGSQIRAVFNNVAVGTTNPESGADFKNCGAGVTDRFLIPPTVNTAQRNTITTPVDGGLIFNTSTNTLQFYSSGSWTSLATGGGQVNQNAFSNVAVSGQTTVAADTTTDTLSLIAGSNVTITTNATSDSVTISATDTNTTYSVGDNGLTKNNFTDALKTKLDGIESSADVTDATNVASAGAIMDGDFTSNGFMKRTGAGTYTVDTSTYLTSVPSGYLQNLSEDTTPQLGGNLDVQAREINTSTSNGNIKLTPNGSGVVEVRGAGGNDGTLQLNCSAQSHGIKLKSPPHSASASYTLTFPNNIVNGQFLKTDASGNLSWDSRLGAGFVNAADYGLDASATSGSTNVDAINAAIAALGTNGGTILFPGGMFYLNAAISLGNSNNSIRFVGSGHQNYGGGSDAGGTVLRRDADDEFFNITNSRAIHFIGITFKGGAANGNGGNSGISGGNGAIYVLANAGCQGYLIENCVFHGVANCITFKGLSDSIIRGCRFRNVPSNEGAGALIKLDENGSEVIDQIRIQDCVLDGSPDGSALNANVDGIAIYNTVSTVYVTNTSAIRLKRSFYSDSSWDGNFFYFQNSEAERASSDGFSINGTGNFVTIDNCFSSTNNGHGINIGSSQNSSLNITNPNVRDNSGHGILIDGPTNNCSIVNPAVGGNSRGSSGTYHGIVIGTNANNVYITGGKIGGNTDELAGTGTQGYGIQINGNTHSNIRIIGTNVTGNATNSSEGITLSISSGTGNSIQFNAGSTVALDT